jgi:hypothetical protein
MAAARRASAQHQQRAPESAPANALTNRDRIADLIEEDGGELVKVDPIALESITKSEVAMQLDAAHRWKRSIKNFREEAANLATMTRETAQSCIYTLPARRGSDAPIVGPSVRLAEICATSWGNLHTAARIIEIGERDVTAQAQAWDLEKNLRMGVEVKRGIMTGGDRPRRYGDDMIRVTSMAAISIALRNVILRIIPRALINEIYEKAALVATGKADGTFEQERQTTIDFLVNRWHIELPRILARLGVAKVADIDQDGMETLLGLAQGIKNRDFDRTEAFPPVGGASAEEPPAQRAQSGDRSRGQGLKDLTNQKRQQQAAKSEPPPANDALTVDQILRELSAATASWAELEPDEARAIIEKWSAADKRAAFAWAQACNEPDDTASAELPPRPACTLLNPEPGSEG